MSLWAVVAGGKKPLEKLPVRDKSLRTTCLTGVTLVYVLFASKICSTVWNRNITCQAVSIGLFVACKMEHNVCRSQLICR